MVAVMCTVALTAGVGERLGSTAKVRPPEAVQRGATGKHGPRVKEKAKH